MDLRDSPAEAEFRARFRAWLAANNPGLPVSSTDDEYWARQAEWHTALYDAGRQGLFAASHARRRCLNSASAGESRRSIDASQTRSLEPAELLAVVAKPLR